MVQCLEFGQRQCGDGVADFIRHQYRREDFIRHHYRREVDLKGYTPARHVRCVGSPSTMDGWTDGVCAGAALR